MTGRGTPYGLDVAPVIKVCSRTEMKEHWFDLIDISAGQVATGEKTIADVGQEIFDMILDVASPTATSTASTTTFASLTPRPSPEPGPFIKASKHPIQSNRRNYHEQADHPSPVPESCRRCRCGRPAGRLRRQRHLDHRSLVGRCFHRARRRRSVPEHELVGRRVPPRNLPGGHRCFYGRSQQHHGEPNLFGMDPLGRYHVHQICRRRGGRCLPDQLELDVQIFGSGPGIYRPARIQRLHRLLPVGSERH